MDSANIEVKHNFVNIFEDTKSCGLVICSEVSERELRIVFRHTTVHTYRVRSQSVPRFVGHSIRVPVCPKALHKLPNAPEAPRGSQLRGSQEVSRSSQRLLKLPEGPRSSQKLPEAPRGSHKVP